jgi:hypothetical protein
MVLRSSAVAEEIYTGNATTDAAARGWLLGHFMPPGDPRNSDAVEIKWGVHPAGEQRQGWVTNDPRSILSVLISGRFRVDLPDRSVTLARQGDYVVFHGVNHTWQAEEESVVVSVRWPSLPGYDPGRPG